MTEGPGRFDLGELMAEARALLKGTKTTVFLIVLLGVGVNLAIGFFLVASIFLSPSGQPGVGGLLVGSLTGAFLGALIAPGLTAVGLHRAARQPVHFGLLGEYMRFFPWFLVLTLAGYAIEFFWPFGDLLISIIMLVFGIFTMMAGYFIIDAQQDLLRAIESSFALVAANFGQVLLYLLLSTGLVLAGVLTFGIGLIWFLPLLVIISGLIYREAAGIRSLEVLPEEAVGRSW